MTSKTFSFLPQNSCREHTLAKTCLRRDRTRYCIKAPAPHSSLFRSPPCISQARTLCFCRRRHAAGGCSSKTGTPWCTGLCIFSRRSSFAREPSDVGRKRTVDFSRCRPPHLRHRHGLQRPDNDQGLREHHRRITVIRAAGCWRQLRCSAGASVGGLRDWPPSTHEPSLRLDRSHRA